MAVDVARHLQRYEALCHERATWDQHVDEIYEFFEPRKRVLSINASTPGATRTQRLFDGTGINAKNLLSATMQGSLTSDALPWFSLVMRDEDLNNA